MIQGGTAQIFHFRNTTPTAFSSTIATGPPSSHVPVWFAIRANSSTSFDHLYSFDGRIWNALTLARNPSLTIAAVGIGINSENSLGFAAAFEYLRIWTSAKTFLGVV